MGAAKTDMMVLDDKREVAEEIAVTVGLLRRCDVHGYVTDPLNSNYEAAYKYANYLISSLDPLVDIFRGNRRELTDLLKDICDGYGETCPGCEANRRD